ncbi:MAG: hypothetical protein K6C95_09100 [Lachnospiraceae bacterium]|nr:hypothetical protein [Lachnospiraceae bacterium]
MLTDSAVMSTVDDNRVSVSSVQDAVVCEIEMPVPAVHSEDLGSGDAEVPQSGDTEALQSGDAEVLQSGDAEVLQSGGLS